MACRMRYTALRLLLRLEANRASLCLVEMRVEGCLGLHRLQQYCST